MSKETEKKIHLEAEDLEKVLSKCERIFKTKSEPYLQRDEYFDRLDELFKKEDYTLRFRTDVLPTGNIYKVAVKGPRLYLEDKTYTRIDIEFLAPSVTEFHEETKRKNLRCVVNIEKQRWKFKSSDLKITIDKYPFIGYFLEIESSEVKTISEFVNLLGLVHKDPETRNSTELLEDKLKEINLPIRPNLVATFDLEEQFYKNNLGKFA